MRRSLRNVAVAGLIVAAGAAAAFEPGGPLQTWRVEGVVHDVTPADGLRPPVLHLAPGFAERGAEDQSAIVSEIARAVEPPTGPRMLIIRAPDRRLLGRWTPQSGLERLN
ncbi:MAG: hypothetical protein AAF684_01320 [Pseudomonadota bacterium]